MMDGNAELESPGAKLDRERAIAPPYVSFSTFRTLLDWLRSEGVPLRFDRSFWQPKFSGSTGTQLVAALRFLGLLQGDRPLPDLEGLVQATADDRRFILKELLKYSYDAVPFGELDRATPAMVRQWFMVYPIGGHTLRKAISFFVGAAKEAEVPMSNAVRKMAKSRATAPTAGATVRDRQDVRRAMPATATAHRPKAPPGVQPSRTTIQLESGGEVTVDIAADLFQLTDRDREFVLALVYLTQIYMQSRGGASPGGGESTDSS